MLKLDVIHFKGIAPTRPISVEFDKVGGTIGRGDGNALVLPDAERIISRMHARISFRSGQYFVEDHGSSTPVIVNGHSLGRGVDAPLSHGDDIKIGDYRLRATVQESRTVIPHAPVQPTTAGATAKDDPLAMFGGGGGADPFADLAPPPKPAAPVVQAPLIPDPFDTPAPSANAAILPADFDPFANLGTPATPAPKLNALPDDPIIGFNATSAGPGINTMFGLGTPSAKDPLAISQPIADPTGARGLGGAASLDPMAAFESKPTATSSPTQRNDVPELNASFVPPRAVPDPALVKPAAPVMPTPAAARVVPVAAAKATPDAMLETQKFTREDVAKAAPVLAFLDGAGIADLDLPAGLTPETMHMLGQVLRETVQAMLDLLVARAMLKRELRADVTMMEARENNPLKFSPNVEAALTHLLAPQRGFMLPLEAVQDACNDLRSHQFAFMAGMRAALAGILKRFSPEHIEQRLKGKSVLDSLLPANRKAKMWDQFGEVYGDMAREAEDDFHSLFGREFVRAYEEQIRKLSQESKGAAGR